MNGKLKNYLIGGLLLLLVVSSGCNKSCNTPSSCTDTLPTNEACAAYFQRWFYNPSTKQCEQKSYSGCSERGFSTQAECTACDCTD